MHAGGWITSLALSAAVAITAAPRAQRDVARAQAPRLAVLIVIDQMRADYVERFKDEWTSGLRRLLARGAWFSNAAYPYSSTVTCAGHATISTGTFPSRHGIIRNSWFDRRERRAVTCTEDAGTNVVSYGMRHEGPGESPARLRVPAFADEMRAQRGSRVVSLSLKARSAIMLAGRGGDAVTWLSESPWGWETSSAFGAAVPEVAAFVAANPVDADYGKTWDRLLPPARYEFPDILEGEAPPNGWTPAFPHVLSSAAGKPDEIYFTQWEHSPFADVFLGRLAAALAESFHLGLRDTTDVLAVSFSSPDRVGHAFGPRSQEVQDMYARLDGTIGALLDRLDAVVGRDRYVVALTSDHGVTDVPEQLRSRGKNAGRLRARTVSDVVERLAQAAAGPGRYVMAVNGNDVYFESGMYDKLASAPSAMKVVVDELAAQPGIARVFRREELAVGTRSRDDLLRAAALSYIDGESGDLVLTLDPGWMFAATGTTHGSARPDDQRVPIILFGPGVRPGQYRESATPADIAPTLAALVGITMPAADGRVLRAALAAPPLAPSTRP